MHGYIDWCAFDLYLHSFHYLYYNLVMLSILSLSCTLLFGFIPPGWCLVSSIGLGHFTPLSLYPHVLPSLPCSCVVSPLGYCKWSDAQTGQ